MTGVEFFRRKLGLTQPQLSVLSGICVMTIQNYEHKGISDHSPVSPLLNLADTLGVTLDELLAAHDASELTTMDRIKYRSAIDSPHNAVNNYRVANNLRFQELAERLGVGSREAARVVCRRETALEKHILALSSHEHLSPERFLERYLPNSQNTNTYEQEGLA